MAGAKQIGTGLLFRLIAGIFIPILLAFALMACILFLNINIGKFQFPSIKGIWLNSLNELGGASLKESTSSVNTLGEAIIRQQANDVAKQLEIHLKGFHKKISPEKLFSMNEPVLMDIVTQKVGKTGYITIFDITNTMRYHPNPKMINAETVKMYGRLGPDFVKINETALAGQDNGGYYQWPEEKTNILKPKYMHITRVKGTDYFVAATTWIDEFSQPAKAISAKMEQLQKKYSEEYNKRFGLLLIILVVVMIVLFVVIYFYASYSIVRPIRHLSEVADKISMGDMNATVDVNARGEIGVLARSIERMQTSVKAAIERLQKRR
jgi:nitrogen fixation/metabolism regulation signal transduction histidine kinase